MIASLRGTLLTKTLDRLVVDVNGVGYLLAVSAQTLADLPPEGQPITIHCHTHVREDALQLFGFASPEEQRAFELLIGVSGIGPKLALTILSGMNVGDLSQAIAEGQHARLVSIPGIGKKTAERLVVELKDRFARWEKTAPSATRDATPRTQEVVEALVNLGYKRPQAERAVQTVTQAGDAGTAEALLRKALVLMSEG